MLILLPHLLREAPIAEGECKMAKKKAVVIYGNSTQRYVQAQRAAQTKKSARTQAQAEKAAFAKSRAKQNKVQALSATRPKSPSSPAAETKMPDGFHPVLVPALDALIGDPKIINPDKNTKLKAKEMLIPAQYIDRVAEMRDDKTFRGETATILLDYFESILEEMHSRHAACYTCANGMIIRFIEGAEQYFTNGADRQSSTAAALATASYLHQSRPGEVAILSGDNAMLSKALKAKLDIAKINPEVYAGRRKLVMPEAAYSDWFEKGYLTEEQFAEFFPDEEPLHRNEFVEFVFDDDIAPSYDRSCKRRTFKGRIGRYVSIWIKDGVNDDGAACGHRELQLQQLHYIDKLPPALQPRNAGQAMLCEALMAPYQDIAFVICMATFGTGKTYLSTNIGLELVGDKESVYNRVFLCPRDSKLGNEIGYVPGDEREKTLVKLMSVVDNIRSYLKNKREKKKGGGEMTYEDIIVSADKLIDRYVEVAPMNSMGGRNLSDSWIIYDEAQDFERGQIEQLMGRIGECSKMVIIGDPGQVSNRHMNRHSCGINYAAVKMRESECAAIITMTKDEIERSFAAREVARCMGK